MSVAFLHMYDDVTVSLIPAGARYIAVYVDGRFANEAQARARFPHATLLTITVRGTAGARSCDCENGDLTPEQAAQWASGEIKAGRLKPIIYASVSQFPQVIAELERLGHSAADVGIWTAHYTNEPHICSPNSCAYPGFSWQAGGTQFTDTSGGRSLDESLIFPSLLQITVPAPDPYAIYRDQSFAFHGKKLPNERELVKEYDRLRKHGVINRKALKPIRAELLLCGQRIAELVMSEPKVNGHYNWKPFDRGRRFQGLIHRSQGKRW